MVNYKDLGFVNTKEMFAKAMEGKYAVPAYNFNNMEQLQAIMTACLESQSPVIIQVSSGARKYANQTLLRYLGQGAVEMMKEMAKEKGVKEVPVAMHLDHGDTFETCKQCVDDGFTSVMIDGSHHSFEDNIKLTKQVVDYAHDNGVVVEAELGQLGGIEEDVVGVSHEDIMNHLTDPAQAVEFVEKTGVDSLAVAIGTSHGAYKFKTEPKLAFDVVEKIGEKLPGFPLVMHGSSSVLKEFKDLINKYGGAMPDAMGVPEKAISKAAKLGVCKVNIDTDLRMALTAKIRQVFAESPADFDPRKYLGPGREAIDEMVKHKLQVLGCAGKAAECL